MPQKIAFFNYYHNGDVHVSRGFVRQIMNKVRQQDAGAQFFYGHRNASHLLSDIPDLIYYPQALNTVNNDHAGALVQGDFAYLNTWYGQQQHKYMNRHGITIDSIYDALNDSCKYLWGFSLDDISTDLSTFFPVIDYSKFNIAGAKAWVDSHPGSKILVENGRALSGQATNFDMVPIIINLAQKHQDKTFILTTPEKINLPNVVFSGNIINSHGTDLNEISFLSTHCDMVIGRASGVFSFTLTQENLFQRSIKYLCFSNLVPRQANKFWLGDIFRDRVNYTSSILTTNESDIGRVQSIIEENL